MILQLHTLKKHPGSRKKKKRLGRGNASGSGNYSGRGMKGQKARSGGKSKLKQRGLRSLMKKTPKLGGFKSRRPRIPAVNIRELEKYFPAGSQISARDLVAKKLIASTQLGVKILGQGRLTKSFTVVARNFSQSAKKAIEKAGGKAIRNTK